MPARAPALPAEERRAAIVAAVLPLVLERGANVSTRQIALAAGVAEGTIFGVFPSKESLLRAALETLLDPEPVERALATIDSSLSLEDRLVEAVAILQRRLEDIWRLLSVLSGAPLPAPPAPPDLQGLIAIFESCAAGVRIEPLAASRQLRAITLALSNPTMVGDEALTPREIVRLFLRGVLAESGDDL